MEKEKPDNVTMTPIRIFDINLVPDYLFEQIDRTWDVKRIYELSKFINTSPLTMLWAFINKRHEIKGVLWCTINVLDESIFINVLSIDPVYRGEKRYSPLVVKILNEAGFKKIRWVTVRPEIFEPFGFKRSDQILMEV